jgi:hypothetical protein
MRRRAGRRNLVTWSLSGHSASRSEAPGLTRLARTRRIRRCVRTGALLTAIGLLRLPRGVCSRWRPLAVLSVCAVFGVMLLNSAWGLILGTGLSFFLYPLLIPASPHEDRKRRYELERESPVYSIPADCHQIVWPP